jgi:hypothetical protein
MECLYAVGYEAELQAYMQTIKRIRVLSTSSNAIFTLRVTLLGNSLVFRPISLASTTASTRA